VTEREVTYIVLGNGEPVDSALLVCQECHVLDLATDVWTGNPDLYIATDSKGHSWSFNPRGPLERQEAEREP
jgi:hypothetical protein